MQNATPQKVEAASQPSQARKAASCTTCKDIDSLGTAEQASIEAMESGSITDFNEAEIRMIEAYLGTGDIATRDDYVSAEDRLRKQGGSLVITAIRFGRFCEKLLLKKFRPQHQKGAKNLLRGNY